jgi:hypothetical protein
MRDQKSLSLVLTFDNQAKFEIAATAGAKKAVGGVLPAQGVEALRKSRPLVATANKQTVQFDLAAAGNVVSSIENCVDRTAKDHVTIDHIGFHPRRAARSLRAGSLP